MCQAYARLPAPSSALETQGSCAVFSTSPRPIKRSQHFPPKNGVQATLVSRPLGLESIRHVRVHAGGDLLLHRSVEAPPDAGAPRLVRQFRDIAGVDRLIRQRRLLGEALTLLVGQRRKCLGSVANPFRFHNVASLAAWPAALK